MPRPHPSSNPRAGFTLLELLLVVIILSSVAFMMISTVDNDINQVRYNDTKNRLTIIRRAIIGQEGRMVWEHGLLNGFVVDNGCLPRDIDDLVNTNGYAVADYVPVMVEPDPTDETEDPVEVPGTSLFKGYRAGYLATVRHASTNAYFSDGWGTTGTDDFDDNHGWLVTTNDDSFAVSSYGMDGAEGMLTSDFYEGELAMSPTISSNDWQVVLCDSVSVHDLTGTNSVSGVDFYVALAIYKNQRGSDPEWSTIMSDPVNWESTSQGTAAFSTTNQIPIGEHLFVLIKGDEIYTNSTAVVERVKVYPRTTFPDVELVIYE